MKIDGNSIRLTGNEVAQAIDAYLGLRLHHRRWHQAETKFVADHDPNTGKEHREYKWSGFPRRNPVASPEVPTGVLAGSAQGVAEQVAAPAPLAVDSSPNSEDHKQRLTFRFLRLPTLDRYQIALKLGLMREGDDALPPNTVFLEVFQRAVDARRLADLWDETEKRHDDRAPLNPFRSPEQGIQVGPRTIRIAGRMPVPPAEVYVDPSGRVVDDRLETALETLGIDRDGAISEADARRLFEYFWFAVAW